MERQRKLKVVVADDSSLMRERIIESLSELTNAEVVGEAEDGLQAMSQIRGLEPDVVILDIRMPKVNGIKVLESIKHIEKHPVVIVLTSYPYPQYRRKCIEAGARFFFSKSTEFDKVSEVVQQLATENQDPR